MKSTFQIQPVNMFCSFLRLLVLFMLCGGIYAQRPDYEVPKHALNRLFWVSSDWPISRFLNKHSIAMSNTQRIIEHVARVEKAVLKSIASRAVPGADDPLRVCNSMHTDWARSAYNHFGRRGFADPNRDCITDLYGTKTSEFDIPPFSEDELFELVLGRALAINEVARNITDVALGNWTEPELMYRSEYRRLSQECTVHPLGAVREQGHWHIMLSITNAPQYQQKPNFERQYLIEYTRVGPDGRYAKPPLMRIPKRGDEAKGIPHVMMTNATTSLGSWRGAAGRSIYGSTYPEDNPAVIAALDGTDLYVQQAEDAMTPSGIAILVLPLFFNMVPVALLADVSTVTMLLYILMSDILTAIPLCIKGAELISIGRRRERSVVLRISSPMDGTPSNAAAAELWAAECKAKSSVLRAGIAFVVLALVFMVFGVIVELVARRMVRNRMKLRKRLLAGHSSGQSDGSSINSDKVGVPDDVLDMDFGFLGGKERME